MTDDRLERILSAEDSLEPSSGFAASVMDAVRVQAHEPPPLRFPWPRFAVGLVACLTLAAAGAALGPRAEQLALVLAAPLQPLAAVSRELGYAALALIVSLALTRLPRLLARG